MLSKKITIIDYGCGNILNLARAIKFIGYEVEITHYKNKIINSSHVVLPGVGAFGYETDRKIQFTQHYFGIC
jgi:imidazoleglycerol phosphate synthase glutamine amidotransferase subunit HisH